MKLSPAQWRMLDQICRSNGGGVFVGFGERAPRAKTMMKLHDMGLVQGKSGDLSWAVHTKEGLALWRSRQPV